MGRVLAELIIPEGFSLYHIPLLFIYRTHVMIHSISWNENLYQITNRFISPQNYKRLRISSALAWEVCQFSNLYHTKSDSRLHNYSKPVGRGFGRRSCYSGRGTMTNLQESDIQKISDTQIQYTIYEDYNTLRKEATVIC